jgi:hypothetical protein
VDPEFHYHAPESLLLDPVLNELNLLETEVLYEFVSLIFATCSVCLIIFHSITQIFGEVDNFELRHYLIFSINFFSYIWFAFIVSFLSHFVSVVNMSDDMSK